MSEPMLRKGEILSSQFGGSVTVGEELGEGTQGSVYRGTDSEGNALAIKWYSPEFQVEELRAGITYLIMRSAPSRRFLWPEDLVSRGNEFGYTMALRPSNFQNVPKLLARKVSVKFKELVQAANQTVSAFKALQAQGLFYCDISEGNLFFDPRDGDVLICDNDNVGSSERKPSILGTPRYMAPEIVRGEVAPSSMTDSFSMAVLLFLLLFNDHPLQGEKETRIRCFDAAAMRQIYGVEPVFIFDPSDDSNRPVPGIQVNAPLYWAIYPDYVKEIFTRVFTIGLRDPGARPTFADWQKALGSLQDAIIYCSTCDKQNFYVAKKEAIDCWNCSNRIQLPFSLATDNGHVVMLNRDSRLYGYQIQRKGGDPGDRGEPLAEVMKHPTLDIRGLKNLGSVPWHAKILDGVDEQIDPGRTLNLQKDTSIDFGDLVGVVRES
jgi:serine/threonine protein kinase